MAVAVETCRGHGVQLYWRGVGNTRRDLVDSRDAVSPNLGPCIYRHAFLPLWELLRIFPLI